MTEKRDAHELAEFVIRKSIEGIEFLSLDEIIYDEIGEDDIDELVEKVSTLIKTAKIYIPRERTP